MTSSRSANWKARAARLREDACAVYFACRDPRVPWAPKLIASFVAVYALSPIDLIPDFVPVIGVIDDLIILPLGLAIVARLIPPAVLEEHRARAADHLSGPPPRSWAGAAVVVVVWAAVIVSGVAVTRALIAG